MRVELFGGPADGLEMSVPMPPPDRVFVPVLVSTFSFEEESPLDLPTFPVLTYLRRPSGRYVHDSIRR